MAPKKQTAKQNVQKLGLRWVLDERETALNAPNGQCYKLVGIKAQLTPGEVTRRLYRAAEKDKQKKRQAWLAAQAQGKAQTEAKKHLAKARTRLMESASDDKPELSDSADRQEHRPVKGGGDERRAREWDWAIPRAIVVDQASPTRKSHCSKK